MSGPHPLRPVLEALLEGRSLDEQTACDLLLTLTDPTLAPALAGALLAALRAKGVTADELRGFARGMRGLARRPKLPAVGATVDVAPPGEPKDTTGLPRGSKIIVGAMLLRGRLPGCTSLAPMAPTM